MRDRLEAQLSATKRDHILAAAARVFAEKGFHATTVKDVAQAAGVANGTIYTHFQDKTALLFGLFDLMTHRNQPQVPPLFPTGGEPHAVLRDLIARPLAALTAGNAELFRVIVAEVLFNRELAGRFRAQILEPMLQRSAEMLGQLIAPGQRSAEQLEVRVRVMSGVMLGVILQRVMGDSVLERRWDDLPDQLAGILLDGIGGEEA